MGEDEEEDGSGTGSWADKGGNGGRSMVEVVLSRGEIVKERERISAPFLSFIKQKPVRRWFSDASFKAVTGLCIETG